jgi:hypothetical protein
MDSLYLIQMQDMTTAQPRLKGPPGEGGGRRRGHEADDAGYRNPAGLWDEWTDRHHGGNQQAKRISTAGQAQHTTTQSGSL